MPDTQINSAILHIVKNGLFRGKTYLFSINNKEILRAIPLNILNTGSFHIESKDIETSFDFIQQQQKQQQQQQQRIKDEEWKYIGNITSPGLFFEKSIVYNNKKNINATIIYKNTSRSGDLMKMKVIIPKIYKQSEKQLISQITNATNLPKDCSQIIAKYCHLFWRSSTNKELLTNNKNDNNIILINKLPKWNQQINAYTLEFGGRALIPSVHNFQLIQINKKNNIILQLGKRTNNQFNIDYKYPLSPYQAFSICLSVIDRTFVWD